GNARGDEALGGDAVEIRMVDDRNLPGRDATGEIFRSHVNTCNRGDRFARLLARASTNPHADLTASRALAAVASSSRAWRRACVESPTPASMRDSSATRAVRSATFATATVRPPVSRFDTTMCAS